MAELADTFFGTIALKNGLLSSEELAQALRLQQAERAGNLADRTLGEICVALNLLDPEEVEQILWLQEKSEMVLEDSLYGRIAVRNGLISEAQLDEVLALQAACDYEERLGELLVERGYLSEQEVQAVLATQRRLSGRHTGA